MSLIFISVPTSGVTADGKLNEDFIKFVAKLHQHHPERTFIVPMLQNYALLPYLGVADVTWKVWKNHCKRLIQVCDELWVIHYDGWNSSTGVRAEIGLAVKYHKKLYHFMPDLTSRLT